MFYNGSPTMPRIFIDTPKCRMAIPPNNGFTQLPQHSPPLAKKEVNLPLTNRAIVARRSPLRLIAELFPTWNPHHFPPQHNVFF